MVFPKKLLLMLYKNMKAMVRSFDGDIDFFDVVTGILQEDLLTPFLFIICLNNVLQTSIDLIREKIIPQKLLLMQIMQMMK